MASRGLLLGVGFGVAALSAAVLGWALSPIPSPSPEPAARHDPAVQPPLTDGALTASPSDDLTVGALPPADSARDAKIAAVAPGRWTVPEPVRRPLVSGPQTLQPPAANPAKPAERAPKQRVDEVGLKPADIARIRATLKLTREQERLWPPVEAVLRDIARQQARQIAARKTPSAKITISSEQSERLYWAAAPLIFSLRPDQKRDARKLARSMGLEQVASAL